MSSLPSSDAAGVYASGSKIYVASNDGVSVSADSGANWTNYSNGYPVISVYASGINVYAGTNYGGILISNDNGQTYTTRNGANSNLGGNEFQGGLVRAVYVSQGGTIYAATGNGLSISNNGGLSFTNVLGGYDVNAVYASGSNVYASTYGGGLFTSTDGGASFSNVLVGDSVFAVYESGGTIYAGTDNGLSISTNGGSSFSNNPAVQGIRAVYAVGSTVYVGSNYSNDLFISTDGGVTFSGYPLPGTAVLGVSVTGNKVYAATQGDLMMGSAGGLSVGVGDPVGAPSVIATVNNVAGAVEAAVTPDGSRVYVTDGYAASTVTVIDAISYFKTVLSSSDFDYPYGIAVTPDGTRAYVANHGSSQSVGFSVSVIDTDPTSGTYNTVIGPAIPVGTNPNSLAFVPDGTRAYVTNDDGYVSVIDTNPASGAYNTVIATVLAGFGLYGISVTPDGTRAYVASNGTGKVRVMDTDPASGTYNTFIGAVGVPNVVWVAVTPDGTRAYATAATGNVSVIDTNPGSSSFNTVIGSLSVGGNAGGIAISPGGTRAYVAVATYVAGSGNGVAVIDTNPTSATYNTVIYTIGAGINAGDVAIASNGARAYATSYYPESVSVISTG